MRRRRPACGWESGHGPHEFAEYRKWDGEALGPREGGPGWCCGWTAAEAGVCQMIRQVHVAMLEKARPDRKFRVEVTIRVASELRALYLPDTEDGDDFRLTHLHGAELLLIAGPDAGMWQLVEVLPPAARGMIPS